MQGFSASLQVVSLLLGVLLSKACHYVKTDVLVNKTLFCVVYKTLA